MCHGHGSGVKPHVLGDGESLGPFSEASDPPDSQEWGGEAVGGRG